MITFSKLPFPLNKPFFQLLPKTDYIIQMITLFMIILSNAHSIGLCHQHYVDVNVANNVIYSTTTARIKIFTNNETGSKKLRLKLCRS